MTSHTRERRKREKKNEKGEKETACLKDLVSVCTVRSLDLNTKKNSTIPTSKTYEQNILNSEEICRGGAFQTKATGIKRLLVQVPGSKLQRGFKQAEGVINKYRNR